MLVLGWLLKFIGESYNKHSERAVIYRDRLTALNTLRFILIQAGEKRYQILLIMAETYLSLKQNAFSTIHKSESPLKKVLKEVEEISKIATNMIPKKESETKSESKK